MENILLNALRYNTDECYTDEDGDIYDYDGNYIGNVYDDFSCKKSRKKNKNKAFNDKMNDSDFVEYCSYFKNRTNNEEGELEFSDYEECKCIYFYPDIENETQYREFDTIESFKEFCNENAYYIPKYELDNIKNQTATYCCLDPVDEDYGEHTIVTDHTFGGLYWTVIDDLKKYESSIVGVEKQSDGK